MRRIAIGFGVLLLACQPGRTEREASGDGESDLVRLAWEVAPGVHPAADSLGEVTGVAVDASGNVYVTDRLAATVWVFDSDGTFLLGFGGKGEGPGEFEAPTGPSVGPGGRLYVRDIYRVTVFGPAEVTGLLSEYEESFKGPVYADWMSTRASRFDPTGALLYPGKRWHEDRSATPFMLRYDRDRSITDTIFTPAQATIPNLTAFVRLGPGGGRILPGLSHVPFAPLPAWDVTPAGHIVSGDAGSYVLTETRSDGSVVATYQRDQPPVPIPDHERSDSLDALRARLDSVSVPLDDVEGLPDEVRALDLPTTYPAYMAVYVGADDRVWVRRWPVGGADETVLDIFEHGGEFVRTVRLPRAILVEPTPYLAEDAVVGVATSELTDESIVLKYDLEGAS